MRYVLIHNNEDFWRYLKQNRLMNKKDAIAIKNDINLRKVPISLKDEVVFLDNWWKNDFNEQSISLILKTFSVVFEDGGEGEKYRKRFNEEAEEPKKYEKNKKFNKFDLMQF